MNLSDAHKFLDLFESFDEVELTCFHDSDRNKKPKIFKQPVKALKNLLNENFIETMANQGYGIFVNVNPADGPRNKENTKRINCFYVDIDKKVDIDHIEPKPQVICERDTGNGWTKKHLYFLVESSEGSNARPGAENFQKIENSLVQKFGGDKYAKDISRVLRIPGTWHCKDGKKEGYKITKFDRTRRPLDYFLSFVQKSQGSENLDSEDIDIKEFIKDSYRKKFQKHLATGDGRSMQLFFVGLDCHGWGVEFEEALELGDQINRMICDPPESIDIVEHQIKSAFTYAKEGFGSFADKLGTARDKQKELKQYKEYQRIREALQNFVYVISAERMVNLITGTEWTTKKQVASGIAHVAVSTMPLDTIIALKLVRVVDHIAFNPQEPKRIFDTGDNETAVNRFEKLKKFKTDHITEENKKVAIQKFTDHLKYLTTSDYEYRMFQNYLAYIIQKPGKKIDWAPLIISKHTGIGKSMLELLFKNILVSRTKNYVQHVENDSFTDKWTYWAKDKLLVFIHELAQGDKISAINKLSTLITEDAIEIVEKNAHSYWIKNCINFILFSNRRDAIRILTTDRRLCVIYNNKEPKNLTYYKNLEIAFKQYAGVIAEYLMSINLSEFSPRQRPEMTAGKEMLIENSETELHLYLRNQIQEGISPFDKKLVQVNEIHKSIEYLAPGSIKRFTSIKKIKEFLEDADFKKYQVNTRINGKMINRVYWSSEILGPEKIKEILESKETQESESQIPFE